MALVPLPCEAFNMAELHIDLELPEAVVGSFDNVFLWAWHGAATPETCAALERSLRAVTEKHPAASGGLTLILPGTGIPGDDFRKRISAMRRDAHARGMKGGAIVYEGEPLRRSIVRGVVTGLGLLARDIYPQVVFGDVPSATDWLVDRIGTTAPKRTALNAAVEALRARALKPR